MNLQKIKERISKYKEEIDEAEERELTAKTTLIEAGDRLEKTNVEVDGLKRRLVLLQQDLDKTQERVEMNQKKLDQALGRHGDDDEARQDFEATEMERDEQLEALEEECVNAKKLKDEAHTVLVEIERKSVIAEKDYQRAEERADVAEARVEALEQKINGVGEEIRDLEERDYEAAERELLSSEKLKFLEDQLRQVTDSCEGSEREVHKLEELTARYRQEIETWAAKTRVVREECEEIEDLADEQIEAHPIERQARREPEPKSDSEPEPEPEPEPEAQAEPDHEPDVHSEPDEEENED